MDSYSTINIVKFACAAFLAPEQYNGQIINLASDEITMTEAGKILSQKTSKPIEVIHISEQEAIAQGISPGVVSSQRWESEVGYNADIESLNEFDIPLTLFKEWVNIQSGF